MPSVRAVVSRRTGPAGRVPQRSWTRSRAHSARELRVAEVVGAAPAQRRRPAGGKQGTDAEPALRPPRDRARAARPEGEGVIDLSRAPLAEASSLVSLALAVIRRPPASRVPAATTRRPRSSPPISSTAAARSRRRPRESPSASRRRRSGSDCAPADLGPAALGLDAGRGVDRGSSRTGRRSLLRVDRLAAVQRHQVAAV